MDIKSFMLINLHFVIVFGKILKFVNLLELLLRRSFFFFLYFILRCEQKKKSKLNGKICSDDDEGILFDFGGLSSVF